MNLHICVCTQGRVGKCLPVLFHISRNLSTSGKRIGFLVNLSEIVILIQHLLLHSQDLNTLSNSILSYPQGGFVRQELFYMLKDEKDVHFAFGNIQKDGIKQATQGMHTSKFCLNIAGDTPSSNRLFDAIASHCVPVIISDDIELPYEDVLDYSQFCVFVRTSDALRQDFLLNMIRSIGRDEWTRMWSRLKEVENLFEYRYPSRGNDAVQMVWQAVARKVPAVKLKIHRNWRYFRTPGSLDKPAPRLPNNFW